MRKSPINKSPRGVMGDSRLRRVGTVLPMTPDQMAIYKKCRNDYLFFIENFYYIQTLDQGEILFKLWDAQKVVLHTMHKNRRVIGMQSRQSGKTSLTGAYALWHVLFKKRKKAAVGIVAHKASGARELLARIKFAISRIPLWMQQGIRVWNAGNVEFENDAVIFTSATSKNGLRGNTASIIIVDEASAIDNNIAEEFFTAIQPIISSGKDTKMILVSTPLGYNHFYHKWNEADSYDGSKKGTNGFVQFFIHWAQIPGRDAAWAESEKKAIGRLKFTQEYDCAFLGSSLTLIDPNVIANLKPVIPVYENGEGLKIFHPPVQGQRDSSGKVTQLPHIYFGVVDVARGIGGDYSALTIIDCTELPYKVCATYRSNVISPLLFPSIIAKIGRDYNDAFLLVEIKDNGQQIADILYDDAYENLLTVLRKGTRGQQLSAGFGKQTGTQLGVMTSAQVKSIGCQGIKTLIDEGKLLVEDQQIIDEITTFIEIRTSFAADVGYHDDLMMTLVLFGWMTTNQFFNDLTNSDMRERIFQSRIETINTNYTPFMVTDDGRRFQAAQVHEERTPDKYGWEYDDSPGYHVSTDWDDIRELLS